MLRREVIALGALLLPGLALAQAPGLPSVPSVVVQVQGPPGAPGAAGATGPAGPSGASACGQGDLDANCHVMASAPALTAMQAAIPTALGSVPPGPTPAGNIGTPGTYTPGNATPPSLSRSTTVTTASDGTFSVTWTTPLVSASPPVLLIPINAASQPAICNVTTRSQTGAAGKCWLLATQILSALGLTINVSTGSAAGMSVMVFAREPTQ